MNSPRCLAVALLIFLLGLAGCASTPGDASPTDSAATPGRDGGSPGSDASNPTNPVDSGFTPGGDASLTPTDGALPAPDGSTPTPGSDASSNPPPPPGGRRIIGYFTAWGIYGRNYQPTDIPADRLTHINYAFANISDTGECTLGDAYADTDRFYPGDSWDPGAQRGTFHQLRLLKQAHPQLRTLISVGGWTWSAHFSDVALTDASRQRFAASCVRFMSQHGFDGIDIDWEYPVGGGLGGNANRPEDRHNYTLLLAELRRQLDAAASAAGAGTHYLLTIAAPAAPAIYAHLELSELPRYVDWVNLMTYDFHGGWESTTNFNAPLHAAAGDPTADPVARAQFNTDSAVSAYLAAGIPSDRIVVGVPFYGRGWSGVGAANNGLFQPSTGLPMGTWEAGVFDYHDLATHYVTPAIRHWNADAQVPYLYDPARQLFITYDDAESMRAKADYIVRRALGGAMFWEQFSGDDAAHTLLGALGSALR